MSIKNEIIKMLSEGHGEIEINSISGLRYWTKDALGRDVDKLALSFAFVTGIKGGKVCYIESRDYDGIIAEIAEQTKNYLSECAEAAAKNLTNGYREV